MRFLTSIIITCATSILFPAPGFYVWQRVWTDDVVSAVREAEAEGRHLCILAGELEREGAAWTWKRPNVPEHIWTNTQTTAVLRAPASAINDPDALCDLLLREITSFKTPRVQLDIDVPERRLADYAKLLSKLRQPNLELSATLLPAHLSRAEIAEVVKQLDYYVLQVHGIEAPRHRDDPYALMRPDTTRRALERAVALRHPFKVALPTYAYALTFDESGKFKRLYAEGFPGPTDGVKHRITAPDFIQLLPVLQAGHDIIWFRLPVPSDRWTLDMSTLRLLEHGELPVPSVEITTSREDSKLTIYATFHHQITLSDATIPLNWTNTPPRGEFFPLNGTIFKPVPHGTLPTNITVRAAACGRPTPVAFAILDDVRTRL